MLAIVNVTPKGSKQKLDDYEIRVNRRVIGRFKHKRVHNGAAQCLRDAADALDARPLGLDEDFMNLLMQSLDRFNKL